MEISDGNFHILGREVKIVQHSLPAIEPRIRELSIRELSGEYFSNVSSKFGANLLKV